MPGDIKMSKLIVKTGEGVRITADGTFIQGKSSGVAGELHCSTSPEMWKVASDIDRHFGSKTKQFLKVLEMYIQQTNDVVDSTMERKFSKDGNQQASVKRRVLAKYGLDASDLDSWPLRFRGGYNVDPQADGLLLPCGEASRKCKVVERHEVVPSSWELIDSPGEGTRPEPAHVSPKSSNDHCRDGQLDGSLCMKDKQIRISLRNGKDIETKTNGCCCSLRRLCELLIIDYPFCVLLSYAFGRDVPLALIGPSTL